MTYDDDGRGVDDTRVLFQPDFARNAKLSNEH